ncbi:hypothetical protein L249_2005 [Ophiocordyceps polyrhachis-furcata BCC 54312]|uniref:Ubiquitin-conjugating enzyme E2 2 n=1 Tax=Ophiocordyceps polyrhachis-furcata BCC 54312 TaxID=1330021 RepID=A0A367LR36_9HYPO|nr:hypothetical protein L249_2005 [Ophiocordyceps polyrhachis-furcata BCC 54312]
MAQKRLMQELIPLHKEKWAEMKFSEDYPYQPPTFRFLTRNIYHPNVYTDGNLCISILHRPGDDEQSGELASERWNVLHGVESVLRSVLLLMDDPEINSAANVDASVLYRDDRQEYDARARALVLSSQADVPKGLSMPTPAQLAPAPQKQVDDDPDFWNATDDEDADFGTSDSDQEMGDFEEDETEQD